MGEGGGGNTKKYTEAKTWKKNDQEDDNRREHIPQNEDDGGGGETTPYTSEYKYSKRARTSIASGNDIVTVSRASHTKNKHISSPTSTTTNTGSVSQRNISAPPRS